MTLQAPLGVSCCDVRAAVLTTSRLQIPRSPRLLAVPQRLAALGPALSSASA